MSQKISRLFTLLIVFSMLVTVASSFSSAEAAPAPTTVTPTSSLATPRPSTLTATQPTIIPVSPTATAPNGAVHDSGEGSWDSNYEWGGILNVVRTHWEWQTTKTPNGSLSAKWEYWGSFELIEIETGEILDNGSWESVEIDHYDRDGAVKSYHVRGSSESLTYDYSYAVKVVGNRLVFYHTSEDVKPTINEKSGASSTGSWVYPMDYVWNGEHTVGSVSLEWHQVDTKKADIYRLRYFGSYDVYSTATGQLLRHVEWAEESHQRSQNGELIQYHGTSWGSDGSSYEYRYMTTYVDGQWKMTHYWADGRLVY